MKPVTHGMTELAPSVPLPAAVPMSAVPVKNLDIGQRSVKNATNSFCPKYARCLIWTDSVSENTYSPTARHTITDPPLPQPPSNKFLNAQVMETIRSHPHLFPIVMPIKVDHLECLLVSHPSPAFTKSLCNSFQEGFWPWADTHHNDMYPVTWDHSFRPPKSEKEATFINTQRDVEIAAGCFSPFFGKQLLPGMYSTPIHSVPKLHTKKLCLVTNHSTGEFSLNSMIA